MAPPSRVRSLASLGVLAACACGVPAPTALDALDPGLLCDEQGDTTLVLTGSALQPAVAGALTGDADLLLPALRFEPAGGLVEGEPADRADAVTVDLSRLEWTAPWRVELRVDGVLGLSPGTWDLAAATATGQEARLPAALAVAGPPFLDGVEPARACHDDATSDLLIEGGGFLLLADGSLPRALADGLELEVLGGEGCAPLAGPVEGQVCGGLRVALPSASLPLGAVSLSVENPAPAACASVEPLAVEVVLPPVIEAVDPPRVCASGGLVSVVGGPFVEGSEVALGAVPVAAVTWIDATTLEVEVGPDAPLGPADLTVVDPSGCSATLAAALEVVTQPQAFHVDPPVVPAGRSLWAAALLADVNDVITDAWLIHEESGEEREVEWVWSGDDPGRLSLHLPADLAPGAWQVGLTQQGGCPGTLSAGFLVATDPSVALAEVEPPQAWTFDHSPVDVWAADPVPPGQVGFADVPGVWLLSGEDTAVEPLLAVRFHDETRLTAVVPPELDPGVWDLLVVNPDGAWGLLEEALEVMWDAPPSVDSISPATLATDSAERLAVRGRDFRDPTVALDCLLDGAEQRVDAAVDAWSFSSIEATLSTRGLGGALCLVLVENADGSSARWSAVSITNPAQNLFAFEAGAPMVEARRAPAAAAGRVTSVDRVVYALGGDGGGTAAVLDSVERAEVDAWGAMSAWALLPEPLPEPRTLATAATIGRFVYLVGGDDGGGPLASVRRALILDPLDVPWPESVAIESRAVDGLDPGRWSYRVSALFHADDEANPGGESLAGEPLSLVLPTSQPGWAVTLCWSAVEGAVGYRVFRCAEPDASSTSLGWLADVADGSLCFQDDGGVVDAGVEPLPDGSLGAWADLPALAEARSSPCLAAARDPRLDPEAWHLYVAGGLGSDEEPLDTVETLQILVETEALHSAGTWETLPERLSEPRARCGGYTVDASLHTVVEEDEAWVLFAGGDGASRCSGALDLGRVEAGGGLADWGSDHDMSPARAGFGVAAASDFLYAFGGSQGQPSASGASTELAAGSPLSTGNWNSLGISLSEPRLLPGSAQESAVIFVLGGQTETAAATATTDLTHY